jgi:hypothetical protein
VLLFQLCSPVFSQSNTRPLAFRQAIQLKAVTQIATLPEFDLFIVLADGALYAYSIEALVPPNTDGPTATPPASDQLLQKMSGDRKVDMFRAGKLAERTIVVYKETKGVGCILIQLRKSMY